ncbi:MAG: Spy/CpxP family protein refolding chaperone [Methylobacter sp.]
MNKKIITIALALALPLTVAAAPGDKGDFEGDHANRVERLAKNLDLNAEQKSKVEVIFKEQHEKLKAIHEETRARLQAVLTKEQMTKMDEMKKQRHEKWQKKFEALKGSKTSEQSQ